MTNEELLTGGHNGCPGCGASIAVRQALRVLGRKTIITIPASCMATIGGSNLKTAWQVPFFHALFECAPAVASGIRAALDRQGVAGVTVVSWAGDAGSADIGFQALTGAADRNEDILHVCYDNEVYMNTGGQAGSTTPAGAWTTVTQHGKPTRKKDLPAIMVAHGVPYVATASIAYPHDFMAKVDRAKSMTGFRFIQVLAPCPRGWQIPADRTVDLARLAVLSGAWELYEVSGRRKTVTCRPEEKISLREFFRAQGRFDNVSDAEIEGLEGIGA